MNLFIDYVQPLTVWLQQNPHWSLFITFLISLTESLAIIGSIVPGSVTMTAIGILAGSGVMRIDLTLLAATLGAIVGDSLSYLLGYYYSERLIDIWPFKKYPRWLQYGKDFFKTHGGKSVLIGRFVGPLRSIIPVIAGILHMKQWHFFVANVLSAIGWSFLYVMPGVVLGAASHELSTETATHLFVLILILLAGVWLISLIIKWLIRQLNTFLKLYLHGLWIKFKANSLLTPVYNAFTPKGEKDHYPTAFLVLITFFCIISFMIILGLTVKTPWLSFINLPIHLLLQSFNTTILKFFFIFCTQLTSTITIISFFIISSCWFIYHKKMPTVIYLFSLIVFCSLLAFLLTSSMYIPRPPGLLVVMPGSSFPAINLEIATALYGFVLFYIKNTYNLFTNTFKSIIFTILGLSGLGSVYLGDHWLTDILASYFAGTAICLIHCLIYRKTNFNLTKTSFSLSIILSFFISILLFSLLSTYYNFQTLSYSHTPVHQQYTLSEKTWWRQKKPILPIYQLSRIGKRISLLNLQYAGDLYVLQHSLEENGWESHTDSFFSNLLMHIDKEPHSVKLPLLTQLYENKSPVLIMTHTEKQSDLTLELRIWESNYTLTKSNKPLWIGSIHSSVSVSKQKNMSSFKKLINPLHYMFKAERSFIVKQIMLPDAMVKTTRYPVHPSIILIKQKN
ncbi:Legionella secretion system protein Y [Legionella gratiana]|uniref:Legionella secretion system protein Y n=1 Tax=Legionella gratiana TaxID=45066 RepID=A0A378JBX1_9GAMM|nr:VTT domain-containing protein [Legionella gratiana]KTD15647.1 Legionella secretion system protein Y [Legionella gratiana]STX44836.1 Legionella secretion system protein Y [Legionella gratiana]